MSEYIKNIRKYIGHMPILAVGAWLLVVNEENEVLMELRSDFNSWDFPGGIMEVDETIEQTAKRELKEETNLELEELEIVDVFSGKDTYRKYPNDDEAYILSVLCKVKKYHGSLKINDGESKVLKWFKVDEIPENLAPITNKLINKVKAHIN